MDIEKVISEKHKKRWIGGKWEKNKGENEP